ncbi:hypothetical protein AL532_13210 [Pseudomonas monteilii]|nr:hypothetical protein AL532_13210 [Pseudomonas monteilii]QIG20305.1 hypothetical protein FY041_22415 [Pseudomonas monteilii]QIG25556.1 hypothetical protein FY043_22410 [Pseudomonas monteilii]
MGDGRWQYRPLRGLARSHRIFTTFGACAGAVGAGVPANALTQAFSLPRAAESMPNSVSLRLANQDLWSPHPASSPT